MAKWNIRAGHSVNCRGAKAILDEVTENRKVTAAVIKYLKQAKQSVCDCTSSSSSANGDLTYGINKALKNGGDYFVSIHFNKCYSSYDGAIGSEVWTHGINHPEAKRVVDGLGKLGFKNRGIKHSTSLYELRALRNHKMKAMIIEVCFVEATNDVSLYRRLGPDVIGKKIAESLLGKPISGSASKPATSKPSNPKPNNNNALWAHCVQGEIVKRLQRELNKQFNAKLSVDGYFGDGTLAKCPTIRQGARGNITRILQERLNKKGYGTNGIDGIFGAGTTNAVKKIQKNWGLVADGIVGPKTWKAIMWEK